MLWDFSLSLQESLLCHTMELKDIMKLRREIKKRLEHRESGVRVLLFLMQFSIYPRFYPIVISKQEYINRMGIMAFSPDSDSPVTAELSQVPG